MECDDVNHRHTLVGNVAWTSEVSRDSHHADISGEGGVFWTVFCCGLYGMDA